MSETEHGAGVVGPALALVRLSYAFTQDKLLTTDSFIKQASDWGYSLDVETLQALHSTRLLVPVFRVSDTATAGRRIEPASEIPGQNPLGWIQEAARQGRLRDCAAEGYSEDWPYARPRQMHEDSWWNGFVYSSWQLVQLRDALNWHHALQRTGWLPGDFGRDAQVARDITLALTALSGSQLPGILGTVTAPARMEFDAFEKFQFGVDERWLLDLVGFHPDRLRPVAESLLSSARWDDPLGDWWEVLRYSNHRGWSKLRGRALESVWYRIAAELLLRTHERLAAKGHLDPLPDLSDARSHLSLHDRITPRDEHAPSLDRALGRMALAPNPRVLLLVEGATELRHLRRVLDLVGLSSERLVRLQECGSSNVNPALITRFAISPKLGPRHGSHRLIDRPPTALVIAMDPENKWATQEAREEERKKLQDAIQRDVRAQGDSLTKDELDFLVEVFVWGQDSYELANFTDDELATAMTRLAPEASMRRVRDGDWEQGLRTAIATARSEHQDIKGVLSGYLIRPSKLALADELWPVLEKKITNRSETDIGDLPLLKLLHLVRIKVGRLSCGGYALAGTNEDVIGTPGTEN